MRSGAKIAVVVAVAMMAAACTGGSEEGPSASPAGSATSTASPSPEIPAGGTLRVSTLYDFGSAMDPQKEYVEWEFFRCCLLRTLLSYTGSPGDAGGSVLQPDLATELPTVSDDGLTWTFSVRSGITYAPPFQDAEITAADIVRAIEREADPKASAGGYSFYYSVIEGFDAMAAGDADSVSGLATPDAHTLEVTLTQPTGDLGYRFAMPAAAPIPEGAADGHVQDYGRFLVSSGPYMVEGADQVDYSLPSSQQEPASGFRPGTSLVLVRNPSWSADTDALRVGYVDRIEVTWGGDVADLANRIERGDLDLLLHGPPTSATVRHFAQDLPEQLHVTKGDRALFFTMNLAEPPFDDVHVRKAVNLAIDKAGLRQLAGGEASGEIATHIVPNSLEGGELSGYDPYATPDEGGDVEAAKAEMAASAYDADADGICDHESCSGVLTIGTNTDPGPAQAALVEQNLATIGLDLTVRQLSSSSAFGKCIDAASHVGLCLAGGWGKDYADASTYITPIFAGSSVSPGCCNFSLVGATSAQLQEFDYAVGSVPSIDDEIATCQALDGDARVSCWADLDQQLMEEVVPWIPILVANQIEITSSRVVQYAFDSFGNGAALDQLAVSDA
jgi:peptide/nickel transport system substrate-binding protein